MEEIIVSPTIDALIQSLKSASEEEIKFVWGVHEELESLLKSMTLIQSVVVDAERKQLSSTSVKNWLLQLQDAANEAEDIVEEFIVEALEAKREDGDSSTQRKEVQKQEKGAESTRKKKVNSLCSCFTSENPVYQNEIGYKLRSSRKRIDKIVKDFRRLHLMEASEKALLQVNDEQLQNFERVDSVILGREEDKNKLLAELLSDEFVGNFPPVIPIVAPDGMGKTTFARFVYESNEVKKHFKHLWWFSASPDLNEEKIIIEILISTTGYFDGEMKDKMRFQNLIRNDSFLLVLDNVRDDNPNLKKLLKTFKDTQKQSKIIVTTPSEKIGSVLGTSPPFNLEGLSHENCSKLFFAKALDEDNFQRYPNLREIGGKITEKCRGFPLAAKALGGLLCNNRNESEWKSVLESPTWNIAENGRNDTVFPALMICYQQFPANLKMCFKYCSLFPRDYLFQENELGELWIGEGYIQDHESRQKEKSMALFHNLLLMSFFSLDSFWRDKPRFRMHDTALDLAEAVSGEKYSRTVEGQPSVVPQSARHTSLVCLNEVPLVNWEELYKDKNNLRSFLYIDLFNYRRHEEVDLGEAFPTERLHLLLQCKFLRVLRLQGCMIQTLPESIANLKLLRFLDLSYSPLEKVADSVCRLYNLRTLSLRFCKHITQLPKDINKLINLRFLNLHSSNAISHVGNLRKFQNLQRFVVRRETGYRISELKFMTDLKGELTIFSLENVGSGEEAKEANMKNKPFLTNLTYQWSPLFLSGDRDANRDEEVLDTLEPHSNLEQLSIIGYQGRRLPIWVQNLTSLQSLVLNACPKLASLPESGLPNSLQSLRIIFCSLLKVRCKKETGEDWPKIAHIPQVTLFTH